MHLRRVSCVEINSDPRSGGYSRQEIEVLAESLREHGMLRPVLLRETDEGYVIVHGERRWRAAKMIGLEAIPAYLVQESVRDERVAA